MLAGIFLASTIYVNNGALTKGGAVGIIQAFISGSKDIVELVRAGNQVRTRHLGKSVCVWEKEMGWGWRRER